MEFLCKKHNKNYFYGFCFKCKINFCYECLNEHNNHNVYLFIQFDYKNNIKFILNEIKILENNFYLIVKNFLIFFYFIEKDLINEFINIFKERRKGKIFNFYLKKFEKDFFVFLEFKNNLYKFIFNNLKEIIIIKICIEEFLEKNLLIFKIINKIKNIDFIYNKFFIPKIFYYINSKNKFNCLNYLNFYLKTIKFIKTKNEDFNSNFLLNNGKFLIKNNIFKFNNYNNEKYFEGINIENEEKIYIQKLNKNFKINENIYNLEKQSEFFLRTINFFNEGNYFYKIINYYDFNLNELLKKINFFNNNKSEFKLFVIQKILYQLNECFKILTNNNIIINEIKLNKIFIKILNKNILTEFECYFLLDNEAIKINNNNNKNQIEIQNLKSILNFIYFLYFNNHNININNISLIQNKTLKNLFISTFIENKSISFNNYLFSPFFQENFSLSKKYSLNLKSISNSTTLSTYKNYIVFLLLLSDGRIASTSLENSIKIFNQITFDLSLIINEHSKSIKYLLQLKNGLLISCSNDETIKIFKLHNNTYSIIQILMGHNKAVYKIINTLDNNLISCSLDSTIRIWEKKYKKYSQLFILNSYGEIQDMLETKLNEVVTSLRWNNSLIFWDLISRKKKKTINKIDCSIWNNSLCLINENILIVGGRGSIYLINVDSYEKIISIKYENNIYCVVKLNEDEILIGDYEGEISQFKIIENKNLNLIYNKKNIHKGSIRSIILFNNNNIITGGDDRLIKIWQ